MHRARLANMAILALCISASAPTPVCTVHQRWDALQKMQALPNAGRGTMNDKGREPAISLHTTVLSACVFFLASKQVVTA